MFPKAAERYTLSAETLRSSTMQLNGKDLTADAEIAPTAAKEGMITLAPGSCTFLLL